MAVGCPNEAAKVLPSRVFSKHSVTNHVDLFYYCDASLLAPNVAIYLYAAWRQYRLFNVYVHSSYMQQLDLRSALEFQSVSDIIS